MSTKYNALIVTFEHAIHEKDLEKWADALRMFRLVLSVEPAIEEDYTVDAARDQVRRELQDEMKAVLFPHLKKRAR